MKQKSSFLSTTNDFFLISRDVAEAFGMKEAVILAYIEGWIIYKKRNAEENIRYFFDDRWWYFNSVSKMQKEIRIYSVSSLERGISNLKKAGVLITDSRNKRKFDRTLWYSIDYEKLDEIIIERVYNGNNPPFPQNEGIVTGEKKEPIPTYTNLHKQEIKDIVSDSDKNTDYGKTSDSAEVTDIGEYRRSGHITSWKGWGSNKDYWNYIDKVLPNKLDDFHYFCVKYFYDSYLANMGEPHPPYSQKNLEKVVGLIDMYDYGSLEHFEKAVDSFFSKDIDGGYQLLLFLTEGFQKNIGYEMERLEV